MARVWGGTTEGRRLDLAGEVPVMVADIPSIRHSLAIIVGQYHRASGLAGPVTDVAAGVTVMVTPDTVVRVEVATHNIANMPIHRVIQQRQRLANRPRPGSRPGVID
ncbi:MAG: hypothetical protein ABF290_13835 [Thiogranum sp.]